MTRNVLQNRLRAASTPTAVGREHLLLDSAEHSTAIVVKAQPLQRSALRLSPCLEFERPGLEPLLIGSEDAVHEIDLHPAEEFERLDEPISSTRVPGRYCVVNSSGGGAVSVTPVGVGPYRTAIRPLNVAGMMSRENWMRTFVRDETSVSPSVGVLKTTSGGGPEGTRIVESAVVSAGGFVSLMLPAVASSSISPRHCWTMPLTSTQRPVSIRAPRSSSKSRPRGRRLTTQSAASDERTTKS